MASYQSLQERALAILDEDVRHKFLTNVPFHREIRAAWQARTATRFAKVA